MAKLGISLKGVELQKPGTGEFTIVPSGTYVVNVGSAEVKETKNGHALILGYKILEGEFAGKMIKDFLNIVNPSADAQRIALERLATVAWSTNLGKESVDDTDELLGKEPFEIFVAQEDNGEYKNMRVKAVICIRSLEEKPAAKKPAAPWSKK